MSAWASVLADTDKRAARDAEIIEPVDQIIARIGGEKDHVIPILQAIQEKFRWLPEQALWRVCEKTKITPAQIWGIATFYDQFRHKPVGKHIVHVCHGTACHVTGANRVEEALRRQLGIPVGGDTDPHGKYTVESVACLGCCTLAPVVKFDATTYGHLDAQRLPAVVTDFEEVASQNGAHQVEHHHEHDHEHGNVIKVGLGSCCVAKGSDRLFSALKVAAKETGLDVQVKRVGCVGMCHRTPLIEVAREGKEPKFFHALAPTEARQLVLEHFHAHNPIKRALGVGRKLLDSFLTDDAQDTISRHALNVRDPAVDAFLGKQIHIATELFGEVDPLDLDEYLAHDGFKALRRCLGQTVFTSAEAVADDVRAGCPQPAAVEPSALPRRGEDTAPYQSGVKRGTITGLNLVPTASSLKPLTPDEIIEMVTKAGVRGRGGAGFPTGPKWKIVAAQKNETKYVICNGDEGDPGAFMDRMLLESFPYRIIEGLAIAAIAVGAHEGFFYIRREYPLAVERITAAIAQLEKRGFLGEKLLGTNYSLKFSVKEGAGAFVCGEETALIKSIQGERGMPRLRPPFPAESGLWGKPTLINNVETLALLPWVVRHGAEKFAAIGTATSKGTKVFALAGKIVRGGLIEVPMGTTIREIVHEIGGGVGEGRRFKAVQIGGPSGGCIPARLAETPVDYESLREVGAIMGSGGLIALDDADCMVDIARYFLQFTQEQSCGKCTFCRIGTRRMLDLLTLICSGKARREHLEELERLSPSVSQGSLCGLGKTAPNPVVTTLKYFRDEYEAHLQGRCPAGKCQPLIKYFITDQCTGCTICAQHCPVKAIPVTPYARHVIDQSLCTKCDTCLRVCPHEAVEIE
jgi:NADH-quinone oxidoreductase subunit F